MKEVGLFLVVEIDSPRQVTLLVWCLMRGVSGGMGVKGGSHGGSRDAWCRLSVGGPSQANMITEGLPTKNLTQS